MTPKRLALGIAAVLIAVMLIASVVAVRSGWATDKALAYIGATIGRRVSVDAVTVDLAWVPTVRLEGVRVADADWSETPTMVEVKTLEARIDLWALLGGDVIVPRVELIEPRVSLEISRDQQVNWQFAGAKTAAADDESRPAAEAGSPASLPVIRELRIRDARVRYVDHADGRRSVLRLDRVDGSLTDERTRLDGAGALDDEPLDFKVRTGPVVDLGRAGKSSPLSATLNAENLTLEVDGEARSLVPPRGLDLRVDVDGEGIPPIVDTVLRLDPSGLPRYRLRGRIRQPDARRWHLQGLSAHLGDTRLTGEVQVDLGGEKPSFTADLVAPLVQVDQLRAIAAALAGGTEEAQNEPPVALDASMLRTLDADVALEVEEVVATRAPVTGGSMDAELHDGRLGIHAAVSDQTGNSVTLGAHIDASADPAKGSVTGPATGELALDLGHFDLARNLAAVGIEQAPPGILSGQLRAALTGRPKSDATALALPGLGEIELQPSHLRYEAPAIDTLVEASAQGKPGQGKGERLEISAEGRVRGEPFSLAFEGDSPAALRDRERPYALDLRVEIGKTTVTLTGEIEQALTARGLNLEFTVEGPNPARLTPIIGFPLPELPPYSIAAGLNREGDTLTFANLDGRVGDSDLAGDVRVELRDGPPLVYATLYSQNLDFDDLGGLIGATPEPGPNETISARQRRADRRAEQKGGVLPSGRLNLQQVTRAMDGVIDYRGQQVRAAGLPLDDLRLHVEIGDGRLSVDPLAFGIGGGALDLSLDFDTNVTPFAGTVEGQLRRVNLRRVLEPFEIANDALGIVGGRLKLWVEGDSVAQFLGSADGGLLLLMTQGRLDQLLVELAGLDVEETLTTLIGEQKTVPIDCAYVDVSAEDGIAELETAVIDTSDTLFLAGGQIDFGQETLDVVLEPHPKDVSLFSLRTALQAEGPWTDPSFSPGGSLVAGGAVAAALAAAAPLAALVPLMEAGTGDDTAYCDGLVERIDEARGEN